MEKYHKIQSIYKRDPKTHKFLTGQYSSLEIEYLKDNKWEFTEKVDGTNIRVMWNGGSVVFGGKTDDSQMPMRLVHALQGLFECAESKKVFADTFSEGVCLYGEGYGAKIQKGGGNYNGEGVDFALFDVRIGDVWLERDNVEDVASLFGITVAPRIGSGTLADAIKMAKEGFESCWGPFTAEGIVLRPAVEMVSRRGVRIITKVKHKDFI